MRCHNVLLSEALNASGYPFLDAYFCATRQLAKAHSSCGQLFHTDAVPRSWSRDGPAVDIEDSVADRVPKPRQRGSKIGSMVDPFRRRKVWFDSALEEAALVVLLTLPETLEVREQQKAEYTQDGQKRVHYFDYVQQLANGRIAHAVKYEDDVDDELRETLRLVSEQLGDRFADEFRILTEKDLTRIQIENAQDVLDAARDFDVKGQSLAVAALQALPARVTLADIANVSGLGKRGGRAAMTLVQKGLLKVPPNERLADDNTLLFNQVARQVRP